MPSIQSWLPLTGVTGTSALMGDLEPVAARLWDLVHAGYKANWFCCIASDATEHAAELDRPTLQRLLALPGDLWLDVCGETGREDR